MTTDADGATPLATAREACVVQRVTSLAELRASEAELWDLFARDPRATPFQSPAWLLPWAEQFAPEAELRVLVARSGRRCVAAVPLFIWMRGGERVLSWLGQGISDRLDALIDPAAAAAAIGPLATALEQVYAEADRLELEDMPGDSPRLGLWRRLGARLEPGACCPVLSLEADPEPLRQRLPRWLSRNVQQTERRLAALGSVRWQRVAAADALTGLDALIDLHSARWRTRGEPGVLADPAVRAFHRASAPALIERGLLELELLHANERPIGASYVLRRRDAHLYLFGFDPESRRLSLGSLLVWRSIERAARAGLQRYDFLRGAEAYKYDFGARDEPAWRAQAALGGVAHVSASANSGSAEAEKPPASCPRTRSA